MTFEELKERIGKNAKLDTQANRVNYTLQMALNYAMVKECELGEQLDPNEICSAVIDGVVCMLLHLKFNFNADDLPNQAALAIVQRLNDKSTENRAAAELGERFYMNPHKGRA